ncbi:MAG: tRNA epoxyqueuosine(34) reductase QueG [Planctomycetaceae bacterium]|nr:tRNA epoxyqueuosine(34) reductase QueG [Planctomycetaceae bacterium]
MVTDTDRVHLAEQIKQESQRLGFELGGIASAVAPDTYANLQEWLGQGFAGEMEYMANRESAYAHPDGVMPSVRSVVMLGMSYGPESGVAGVEWSEPPAGNLGARSARPQPPTNIGRVATYAQGSRDYHDVIRDKLKSLANIVHKLSPGCRTRGVVDTAPLLERDFARLAGLGWFGKNTMLINKFAGSYLFLAALLLDVELPADQPHETAHCGTCTRCLEACPTDAFVEPYVLDSRRCISYLTIELRDKPIPIELRDGMGDWLFGCDVCQDVCPWNRKAPAGIEDELLPTETLSNADARELLQLSEDEFRERFRRTPLYRPKRSGILRNAAIVLGNSGDERALPALIGALEDQSELVRGAAAWALGKLGGGDAASALQSRAERENNAYVMEEINAALERIPW